jgi:hypothetical protein
MQKKQLESVEQEKVFVIDIQLNRGLIAVIIAALVLVAGLSYFAFGMDSVSASSPQAINAGTTGLRQFYVSTGTKIVDGANATSACADGYHMASLWEIYDTSNLEYNTSLGATTDDSGQGAPNVYGWVRTGWGTDTSTTPGRANCNAWISNAIGHHGTVIMPEPVWQNVTGIPAWFTTVSTCNIKFGVWCIED